MELKEKAESYTISGTVKCSSCKGKGLYKGMAEKNGARVVCHKCKGSGKVDVFVEYPKFRCREVDCGAKRVYSNGMGYAITDEDITTEGGRLMPFSKFGCSYGDWQKGTSPKPLEFLGCPYQETDQGLQSKDVNDLYKKRCREGLNYTLITNCKHYSQKDRCWNIYNHKDI